MEKDLSSRKSFVKASDNEDQKLKEQIDQKDAESKKAEVMQNRFLREQVKKLKPEAREVVKELDRSFKEDYSAKEAEHQNNRRENFKKAKKMMLLRSPDFGFRIGGGHKLRKRGQYLDDQAEQYLARKENNELVKIRADHRKNIERILAREGISPMQTKQRESDDSIKEPYNKESQKIAHLMKNFERSARESQGHDLER